MATWFDQQGKLANVLPGFESRPGQEKMSQAIAAALLAKYALVVEAGTGIGKTFAYLLPLLANGKNAIISTATKTLQDQLMKKDIPLVRKVIDKPFTAVALKGRGNYLCHHRFARFQFHGSLWKNEDADAFAHVRDWSYETMTGDRDELSDLPERLSFWEEISSSEDNCLGSKCLHQKDCFLVKARQRAQKAELVIVNHHLYFADLAVKEDGLGAILPEHDVVLFDEAHQVPDVVTQYFGTRLSSYQLWELGRDGQREFKEAAADDPLVFSACSRLESVAKQMREVFPPEDRRGDYAESLLAPSVGAMLVALADNLLSFQEIFKPHCDRSPGLASCCRRAGELRMAAMALAGMNDKQSVYWFETRGQGLFLNASPLEVGPELREALYPRVECVLFTSATLATSTGADGFNFILEQLGLPVATTKTERIPSPFDFQRRALLYVPQSMPEPDHPDYIAALIEELYALLSVTQGRALCLFTSHRVLKMVREGLHGRLPFTLLTHGERPKSALIEAFKQEVSSVLLATGTFWEGVDVPGEALSAVIIDRLPFASPGDPLVAARTRHIRELGGNPFIAWQVPKAVISMKQGVGRLLRGVRDRGILGILDVRIERKYYGRYFFQGLPPAPITHNKQDVRHFIEGAK